MHAQMGNGDARRRSRIGQRMKAAIVAGCLCMASIGVSHADTIMERIQRGEPIRHAIANDSPYGFIGSDGKITGIEVELVREVLTSMGAKSVEPTITTFGALIPGIQAGRFDIASDGIYIRPERCAVVQFSTPDFMFGVGAFKRKGDTSIKATSVAELAANKSLRLGKLTGGSEDKAYVLAGGDRSQISDFTDRVSLAAAVKSNRIDVGLVTAMGAAAAAANDPGIELITPLKPPVVNGKPFVYYTAFAFNKGDSAFAAEFNKRLSAIVQSPAYRELLAKYHVPPDVIPDASAQTADICTAKQ